LEIFEANPLYNNAQPILETHHVKLFALLIHIPNVDYLADRKTLLQALHNDGYILVSVLPLYAAVTVLSKTRGYYAVRAYLCQCENIRNIQLFWNYVDSI